MLSYIDSDCDRETWFAVCASLLTEYGEAAKSMAQYWSEQSPSYEKSDFNAMWRSLKPNKYKIGTLIKHAQNNGYQFSTKKRHLPESLEYTDEEIAKNFNVVKFESSEKTIAKKKGSFAEMWNQSKEINNHIYLTAKGIINHGWPVSVDNELLIPIYNAKNQLVGLQKIFKNPYKQGFSKIFCKDSEISHAFHCLGKREKPKHILICEGVATGASLYESSGIMTVIAFSVGNIINVTQSIKKLYPESNIFVCADNDKKAKDNKNIGLETARQACSLKRVYHIIPEMKDKKTKVDFNDLHKKHGKDYVNSLLFKKIEAVENGFVVDVLYKNEVLTPEQYPIIYFTARGDAKVKEVLVNFQFLMDRLGVKFRHNLDKYEIESNIYQDSSNQDDIVTTLKSVSLMNSLKLNIDDVFKNISVLANSDSYSPMKNYILSHKWDGCDRLSELYETVPIELDNTKTNIEIRNLCIRKWLLQVVYSVFSEEAQQLRYILTFSGEQG